LIPGKNGKTLNDMLYYRIKIQEKNNGQKTYTPQVGKLKISGLWIKKQKIVWYTVVHAHGNTFGLSETITVGYATEESALKVIEDYKNKDVIEEANKVKSTTYKMIDWWENFIYFFGGYGIILK